MMKTGIPTLDDHLHGGVPQGKSLVYYAHPGVECNVFGMQTVHRAVSEGGHGIYVTSSTDPRMIRDQFKEFGWDAAEYGDRFVIVDGFSGLIGADSPEQYVVSNPDDIESLTQSIKQAMEGAYEPSVIVFESLSTIMDLCGEDETLDAIKEWNKYAMLYDHVVVYNFTAWPYSEDTLAHVKGDICNSVILIGGITEKVIFGQYFGVKKIDWDEITKKCVLFKVLKPGGIRVYLPKILVTGPFDAGKSTFVHALSTRAVSVDRLGTTVALDHGHVDHRGFAADIFGTPGQQRFDPIVKLLSGEAMGIFLILDSANTDDFVRARQMLDITETVGLPVVVVANKQDIAGALTPEEIRKELKMTNDIPVMPAVASSREGVFEAFDVMVERVLEANSR
ncbi:MAG TPA: GTP-binding protein [Methanosarcinales archaeon]|nr:GTP-binding protein [Methanosarcinales archaeon]